MALRTERPFHSHSVVLFSVLQSRFDEVPWTEYNWETDRAHQNAWRSNLAETAPTELNFPFQGKDSEKESLKTGS